MTERTRKTFTPAFKAKIALEAIPGVKTANEIARDDVVHPLQVGQWKRAIMAPHHPHRRIGLMSIATALRRRHAGWLLGLALCPLLTLAQTDQAPRPIAKLGSCPTGYLTSGAYCVPRTDARPAIEKQGPCPTGYLSSGSYCLAREQAPPVIPKVGSSCPTGWLTSGGYCVRRH